MTRATRAVSLNDSRPAADSVASAMERLVTVVQKLSLARDLDAIMQIVRSAARELTGADGATFVLREGDQCYYAEEDAVSPLWKGQKFPMKRCISGWVMLHREPVVIEDIYADPRIPADAYRPTFVRSLVMVPIRTADPLGAIGNYWARKWKPGPEWVKILQALADSTSVAMENVTLYSELEKRVRERTSQLQKQAELLDLAHDAILVRELNPAGTILYWNQGAEATYGYSKEEALGKSSHTLLQTRFPMDFEQIIAELLKNGQWEGELHHRTRDGAPIIVASKWALRRDDSGIPVAVLEINRNITERKQAEEAARTYLAKLERSNRDLEDFAYVASHDLQEPLRKIQAFGDRLKAKLLTTPADEMSRDYLGRMQSAAARMQTLIQSLLDYSRLATRAEPFREVDLAVVAAEVLSDLEIQMARTGGTVEVGELPKIHADASQMRQLLQNLIGNALKFQNGKGPRVKVHATRVPGESPGRELCRIVVEDNGIGFDEKYLDRIFEPFKRLHSRSEFEGTGIGLATCKKIVERHGGTLTAKSAPGKGATFIATLPIHPA